MFAESFVGRQVKWLLEGLNQKREGNYFSKLLFSTSRIITCGRTDVRTWRGTVCVIAMLHFERDKIHFFFPWFNGPQWAKQQPPVGQATAHSGPSNGPHWVKQRPPVGQATAPSGPGPPRFRGFTITLRHTTVGRNPLDE